MMVKPAPGRLVRHPLTKQRIPETPIEVSETDPYWARRLADGDAIEVKPTPASKPSTKGKE